MGWYPPGRNLQSIKSYICMLLFFYSLTRRRRALFLELRRIIGNTSMTVWQKSKEQMMASALWNASLRFDYFFDHFIHANVWNPSTTRLLLFDRVFTLLSLFCMYVHIFLMMPPSKIKWYGLHIIYYLEFKLFMKTRCPSFPLKAEDISGKRTSIYPLLPRSSAAGWHPAAVPYEQESHQVQLHCQSCVHWFTGFVRSENILTLSWQVGMCFRVGNCAVFWHWYFLSLLFFNFVVVYLMPFLD